MPACCCSPLGPATSPAAPAFQLLFFGGEAGAYAAGDDCLTPFLPVGAAGATELVDGTLWLPKPGTVRNLRVGLVGTGTVSVSSAVFTVRQNQVNTALTCTIAIAGDTASDLVNVVTYVAAGDLGIRIDATTLGTAVWATLEYYPAP